jgi:mono/diheme cytochrome c family protein
LSGAHTQTKDGKVLMPAFADAYSNTEIPAVANYVTARFGAAPSQLTAKDVARFRQLSSR